jgi:type IV secretory pathway TrbL component
MKSSQSMASLFLKEFITLGIKQATLCLAVAIHMFCDQIRTFINCYVKKKDTLDTGNFNSFEVGI